ncbi:MAG: VTT domain-containing protein [Lachnospiraceae bacterium]|nr:VTT domain-containing protein [Lachnospiraceae bacterium]
MSKNKVSKVKVFMLITGVFFLAGIFAFLLSGENLSVFKAFFREGITQEEIRENAQNFGVRGAVSVCLLSMMQVVLMFLPAEPVQVVAGVSYGLWHGILLCMAGVFAGNTAIYLCYKVFGKRMSEYYSRKIDIDWGSAKMAHAVSLIVLILYVLPAIPYGMICFFAVSMGLKYPRYTFLTVLGSLPSVFIGVGLGHLAVTSSLICSVIVFVLLMAVLTVMLIKRDALTAKINEFIKKKNTPYTSDTEVRKPNKLLFRVFSAVTDLYLFFKFRVKYKNLAGKIEKPSIILVTHGSFIDFMFSLKFLKKYYPHIVTARLYMYDKVMGSIMKAGGAIPKSMFTVDYESAKNCLNVLKNKEILLMMPEARLSTVGRYEGMQGVTSKFLYKAGVNLYLLKIHGNYFAMPKWGNGARHRAQVECTLSKLYAAEELSGIDFETFKSSLNKSMYYDEYEWLAERPGLKYSSKTLAEGLEGVLYKCPMCGAEGAGISSGRKLCCTVCGTKAVLDDRYHFAGEIPFTDIRGWYDYQYKQLEKEIAADENYILESKVELKHSSINGKKCLRRAGEGICRLDRSGLTYEGTDDGKEVKVHFNGNEVYRLLFGVNEDFELYAGKEIYYFIPENKRMCAKWYLCSIALKDYFKG